MLQRIFLLFLTVLLSIPGNAFSQQRSKIIDAGAGSTIISGPFVAQMEIDGMLVSGTVEFLRETIEEAENDGAVALVIILNTPGGVLDSTQQLVQLLFQASIPVIVYVGPAGATAASAGVFFTGAGHIAAMAPGTTMGAAHPVMIGAGAGDKNQEIMLEKAESFAMAMARSIAEERGRNIDWIQKAVKESDSLTASEALSLKAIDLIAEDIPSLLERIDGKEIKIKGKAKTLKDYSSLPRREYSMTSRVYLLTLLSNPVLLGMLWLGAVSGIGLELRAPGTLVPGVVGVVCLALALIVSQTIPLNYGGIVLLVLGGILIVAETFVANGILATGGIVLMALGLFYLVDISQAPGMQIGLDFIIPVTAVFGVLMFLAMREIISDLRNPVTTGDPGMIGLTGYVVLPVASSGKVFVNGEYWDATLAAHERGILEKNCPIRVVQIEENLVLVVERLHAEVSDNK